MMALAAKLARGERSELFALYIIEVPYTLPPDAEMAVEERESHSTRSAPPKRSPTATMSTIRTETLKARSTKQAVLDIAKREKSESHHFGLVPRREI